MRQYLSRLVIKYKRTILQFFRYGIVGTISTAIHYLMYLLFLSFFDRAEIHDNFNANISYALGYFIGFCFNYVLTTYFTFKTKANKKNAAGFTVSHVLNYMIEVGVLNGLLSLDFDRSVAGLIVIIVAVPINFVLLKISYYLSNKYAK